MTYDQLKEKALRLPLSPGVYIMRNKEDKVIYVGKAKKLKNRVTQYFQDTASHTPKTRVMVSKIHHFDVIVAASEFEALVLECSLIKRYMPQYNILLKDDKGYPYIRLNMEDAYPKITMVSKIADDGAQYYGPYGSRGVTQDVIEAIQRTLKLPNCNRKFPQDVGKGRPCLNYHMNQCAGWCQEYSTAEEYRLRMHDAKQLLQGNYKAVSDAIRKQMLFAAENLQFELAANFRDLLNAVESLSQKQLVTAGTLADTDVVGYGETEAKACFAILHFSGGNLLDKEYEVFPLPDDKQEAVSSLLKQFYLSRGLVPRRVILPFIIDDAELFSQLIEQEHGRKPRLHVPQRGENVKRLELANKNAYEEALRATNKEERYLGTLVNLGKMLSMQPPRRIESFDISNISGTDIVASMVVYLDGKPHKKDYKHFKIQGMAGQDDYASMQQVVKRRFSHFLAGDKGFEEKPDLLLIDGGITHANIAFHVLQEMHLSIPVFGMVKDNRHRTRALVTPNGEEIQIDNNQTIFSFIGNMQEETHRFAIQYHRKLRSKRLKYSELDAIVGIGAKRKHELLKQFKSITAIKNATLAQLEQVLPKNAANAVYRHFHTDREDANL